jgi:hypothetical protein
VLQEFDKSVTKVVKEKSLERMLYDSNRESVCVTIYWKGMLVYLGAIPAPDSRKERKKEKQKRESDRKRAEEREKERDRVRGRVCTISWKGKLVYLGAIPASESRNTRYSAFGNCSRAT